MESVLFSVMQLYQWLIIIYVLMSWFPVNGALEDVYRAIGTLVEPYLNLFRRIIPPIGMIDISPIIAILVLQFVTSAIARLV